ncbi:MAG: hypothetical protein JWM59_3047 [Verrucomicrobiales bacterium]|nr:hypothetical protein [Verrucomicrobiales bacterium]
MMSNPSTNGAAGPQRQKYADPPANFHALLKQRGTLLIAVCALAGIAAHLLAWIFLSRVSGPRQAAFDRRSDSWRNPSRLGSPAEGRAA